MDPAQDTKLVKLTAICGAWPEATRTLAGDHATFRVRGKVFGYFLKNHHGDGIVSVCVKTELAANLDMVARLPQWYYLPAYIGPRGWVGLRLDRGRVDWRLVESLLAQSYRLAAPKTLIRALDQLLPQA